MHSYTMDRRRDIAAILFAGSCALALAVAGRPALAAGDLVIEPVRVIDAPRVFHPGADDKAGFWEDFGLTNAFDLSPTTKLLTAVIEKVDGSTRLFTFDLETGAIKSQPVISASLQSNVRAMKLSPDGKIAAVPMGREKQIALWDVTTGTKIATGQVDGEADDVDWHPSGDRLAVVAGRRIEVWKVGSFEKERTIPGGRVQTEWPMTVRWSPDGAYVAIGTNNPAVYIGKADGSTQSPSLMPMGKGSVYMAEWNPAGDRLAAAGLGSGSEITVWSDPKTAVDSPFEKKYTLLHTFTPPASKGWQKLTWDPSGKWLVFGDEDSNVGIFDAASGAQLKGFVPRPGSKTIEAHWKGAYLVTVGEFPDKNFRIWRVTASP